jgi:hypothetical protein
MGRGGGIGNNARCLDQEDDCGKKEDSVHRFDLDYRFMSSATGATAQVNFGKRSRWEGRCYSMYFGVAFLKKYLGQIF